jgi:hypothetical protein
MLDYIDSVPCIEHFSSEIARRMRVSAMHIWHQRYTFGVTLRQGVATQLDDAKCPFYKFGITLYQAPGFN